MISEPRAYLAVEPRFQIPRSLLRARELSEKLPQREEL
jgi:hypothetical protein